MSKKRRRELLTVDSQLVEIYEDLTNESEEVRLKAAKKLLLASPTAERRTEVLRRLIRGLCSDRKVARIGFSVALTELLSQLSISPESVSSDSLPVSDPVNVLVTETSIKGGASSQEERAHQLGRLFGAEAFIKSGILFKSGARADAWYRILDVIFELAIKKAWLREECGWILYEALQSLSTQSHRGDFAQVLIVKLCDSGLAKTPEGVALWIRMQLLFPGVSMPQNIWRGGSPLHRKEKSTLARILKETPQIDNTSGKNGEVVQKGNWTSKVHFVWNVIIVELLKDKPADVVMETKNLKFADFWQEAVDQTLFAMSSSKERKYWGFILFQQLFKDAPEQFLPTLFGRNFVRCLVNQLASSERYLHRIAEKSIKLIIGRVELQPSAAKPVLQTLLAVPKAFGSSFDHLTKTKTLDRLVTLADDATLLEFVTDLSLEFVRPGIQDAKEASARRQAIADQLTFFVRSREATNVTGNLSESEVLIMIGRVLDFFATIAYSFPQEYGSLDPPLSQNSRDVLGARLSSCLTYIMGKTPDPVFLVYGLVRSIRRKEKEIPSGSILISKGPMESAMIGADKMLHELDENESLANTDHKRLLSSFKLLCSMITLQVYNGDADAASTLVELDQVYNNFIKGDGPEGRDVGTEVLIDILCSLVSKRSLLLRRLAQQVFSAITADVNVKGLRWMLDILVTDENQSGQNAMFEQEEEDDLGASEDDSSIHTSDVDEVERSSTKDAQPTTSEDEDTDSEGNDEELAAFDAKLAEALNTRSAKADIDAVSSNTSSDEDMNDEQMEALDEHLVKIFQERKNVKNKKTERKEAKENVVNFKCRILELLDIFVTKQCTQELPLNLLHTLCTVTRITKSSVVSSRTCKLVQKYSQLCKKQKPGVRDTAAVFTYLENVHAEAMKEGSNAHASACSQASLLLTKALMQDKGNLHRVVQTYAATMEAMLSDPKCKVKPSFVVDWLNWGITVKPK